MPSASDDKDENFVACTPKRKMHPKHGSLHFDSFRHQHSFCSTKEIISTITEVMHFLHKAPKGSFYISRSCIFVLKSYVARLRVDLSPLVVTRDITSRKKNMLPTVSWTKLRLAFRELKLLHGNMNWCSNSRCGFLYIYCIAYSVCTLWFFNFHIKPPKALSPRLIILSPRFK